MNRRLLTFVVVAFLLFVTQIAGAQPPGWPAKGVPWTRAQAWAALRSVPLIQAKTQPIMGTGVCNDPCIETYRFHVVGPAREYGDGFRPAHIEPMIPVGRAVIRNGKKAWLHFRVGVHLSGPGIPQQHDIAFFCLHPLSAVRTTYPYSRFRITGFTFDGPGAFPQDLARAERRRRRLDLGLPVSVIKPNACTTDRYDARTAATYVGGPVP